MRRCKSTSGKFGLVSRMNSINEVPVSRVLRVQMVSKASIYEGIDNVAKAVKKHKLES